MSLTPLQRTSLAWVARPPGPPSIWYAVGSMLRGAAAAIDSFGASIMADTVYEEKLVIPTTVVKAGGASPAIGEASFVAPSANLIGAVKLAPGASVWYGAMLSGGEKLVSIGKLSSVGEHASVVGSAVGDSVIIGAGSLISYATLADECSVGLGCKVGTGCSIGKNAMLAAGSVLPPGSTVPAGEVWAGAPAKKVETTSATDAASIVATATLTAELGALHMEEAWKDLTLVDQEHNDYKRQVFQTPEVISAMREDPGWVPLPTLGEWLAKTEVSTRTFTLK